MSAKLVQGERKSKLVCNFSEPPPNLGAVKVKQTSEEYQMKLVKNGIPLLALALRVPSVAKHIKSQYMVSEKNKQFFYELPPTWVIKSSKHDAETLRS